MDASQETWNQVTSSVTGVVGDYLPKVVAAIVVLVVGWIVALIVAAMIRGAVRKLGLGRRLGQWLSLEKGGQPADVSRGVGKGVFYLLMLFVLLAFFQTLGLTIVTEPLKAFLNQVFEYAPGLVAAAVVLFFAWMVAKALRFVVSKSLTASQLDQRVSQQAGVDEEDEDLPLTSSLAEAVYWLTFLLFLPAVLGALKVPGLLEPVQNMVNQLLGFLPHLLAAAVILGIGWFVARISQRLVTNLLRTLGTDALSERIGLATLMGSNKLSSVLGLLVYILILIPVIVASLNVLQIAAVTEPASEMLSTILGKLPSILTAVLVVGVAYVVGRVVAGLATNMLSGIGFDGLPDRLGIAGATAEGRRTPSQIAGTIVFVAIVLFAVMQALTILEFAPLADMMKSFLVLAMRILMGLGIFGFGLYFAKLVADMIQDSAIANAKLLSTIARVAILILAGTMAVQQTGLLATAIVIRTYEIVLAAVAVAAAIAFGIGGRDSAKLLVDDFVNERRGGEKK